MKIIRRYNRGKPGEKREYLKTYYVSYQVNGRKIVRKGGPGGTKREAEAALAAIKTDILRGEYRFISKRRRSILFRDYAEQYLAGERENPGKRASSLRRDETSLSNLKPFFGIMPLMNIRAGDIETYRSRRLKDGVKPATVNREVACLRHVLNCAERAGLIDRNPARSVEPFEEDEREPRFISQGEQCRLYAAAERQDKNNHSPFLRDFLIIALNSGMRLGEIRNLKWRDVDFGRGLITIRITKSPKPREIPMNAEVENVLRQRAGDKRPGSEYVFLGRDDPKKPVLTIARAFRTVCGRAGLSGLRFHDLRHTALSNMGEKGIDIVTLREIAGHSDIEMTKRYLHSRTENKRAAVEVLNAISRKAREAAEPEPAEEAVTQREHGLPVEIANPSICTN